MNISRILSTFAQQDRLIDAQAQIEAIRAEDPSAICPSAEQLVATERAGLIWNFETGQADEPNPDADARQVRRLAALA